jgi:hypothetical protein
MVIVEKLVEYRLAEETEVLGENLPQRQFVHQKSQCLDPVLKRGRRGGKPATLSFFIIWFVRLLALLPLLAYCASLG